MSPGRWERLAPLTGVVFVALVVVSFALSGGTPGVHASAEKVQSFYAKHHDKEELAAFIGGLSVVFFVFFVSTLRHALRRAGGTGQLANAAFAGGLLAAAGFGVGATIHLAVADAGSSAKTLAVTQTLNVLDDDSFIPIAAGIGVFLLAAGLSSVRHRGIPKWLGWAAIVLGVASFTPAGFFAFLLSGLWIIATSVVLLMAASGKPSGAAGTSPGSA